MAAARINRGQRIGHGLIGVVVGVNAEVGSGNGFRHGADDLGNLGGHGAAIGVAEHHPARTGIMRRLGAGQRVFGVGLVAIEEMFAVDQHFLAGKGCGLHGLADGVQVFFIGAAQRHAHVVVPGLRHKADGWRLARIRSCKPESLETERPARFTMPKAVKVALVLRSSLNSAVSVGLAPG